MKYRYHGPLSGVTLNDGQEIMLHPGAEVELPEGHDYTDTLMALGHLVPLAQAQAQTKSTKVKGESNGR